MNTLAMLAARHDSAPILSLDVVAETYFDTTPKTLIRKLESGEIDLPIVRLERGSQKSAKGIALTSLAAYLDARIAAAEREHAALNQPRRRRA